MNNAELINELQTEIREIEDDPVNTLRLMWRAADALEAADKRIAELEAQLPKWISMEDRLPEKMKNVLAANNRGKQWDIDKAWYNGAHFDRCGKHPLFHVTHWMPLPDAPKGERE